MISALPGGREFANPGSTSELLTRTRFLLEFNYTDYFTGMESSHWFICQGREKLKRVEKACSRFYTYKSGVIDVNQVDSHR